MDHEAEYLGTLAELVQATLSFVNCLDPLLGVAVSASEGIFEGF